MAKNYYLPKDDSGKAELLEHLANRLPAYAETLEISALDIAGLQADAEAFRDAIACTNAIQANARHWTAFKNFQRDGGVSVSSTGRRRPSTRVVRTTVTTLSAIGQGAPLATAQNVTRAVAEERPGAQAVSTAKCGYTNRLSRSVASASGVKLKRGTMYSRWSSARSTAVSANWRPRRATSITTATSVYHDTCFAALRWRERTSMP